MATHSLNTKESLRLLSENYIGRLGYLSKGRPEIIPITYYFDSEHKSIVSYSGPGNKIEAMRKNSMVSFQVDEITDLEHWKSVLLFGIYEELEGIDAKYMLRQFSDGVKNLLKSKVKPTPDFIQEFSSKIESQGTPIVYRIKIKEIVGRQKP